jgi:hypothetical protein
LTAKLVKIRRATRPFQFSISKSINAPISYAFAWCTDFREDDHRLGGQKRRIAILERTEQRFIMSIKTRRGSKVISAARIVSLAPPNAWHLDWIGDENDETGDYRLTRLSARKTRLNATFKVKPKTSNAPRREQMIKSVNSAWDQYVSALENDYKARQ